MMGSIEFPQEEPAFLNRFLFAMYTYAHSVEAPQYYQGRMTTKAASAARVPSATPAIELPSKSTRPGDTAPLHLCTWRRWT